MRRLEQPIFLTLMIIINIMYNLVLLFCMPIYWMGAIFWKDETYTKMYNFLFNHIPEMPEQIEYDDDEDNKE